MGVNVAIFGYGQYLFTAAQQGHVKGWINFNRNMTLNLEDFKNGRWWPLLTSCFTHTNLMHLGSNMLSVYFLGGMLAASPAITPVHFLTIAVGSGLAGSALYLANRYRQVKERGTRDYTRGLGFSGAFMGISSVAACLMPRMKVAIWGIVPIPLWGLVVAYAAYDGYYLSSTDTRVAHAGHLGGLAFGIVYYLARLRGLKVSRW